MKRLKNGALVLATLLLMAAGAAMPFAAAWAQDAYQADPEVRSFDSFSLTLRQEADLGRTLRLIAGSDYYIAEDNEAEDTRMTRVDVLVAAEELMKEMTAFGLLDASVSTLPRVFPQTLCANDGSAAIPTWTLEWDMPDKSSSLYVWMDDASGKAFLISLPCMSYSEGYISKNGMEPVYAWAENWRVFLEEYYGTEVRLGNEVRFDAATQFNLIFSLGTAEDEAEYQLDLYYYWLDGFTTLNPYVKKVQAIPPANESVYHDS